MEQIYFSVLDYGVLVVLLCLSVAIGLYFGITGRKQQSTANYLYGNRQMKAIPVGLSLYSSALSAISMIGMPYEIYNFGTHYATSIIGIVLGTFVIWYTFLPVFCGNLKIKTPYEYFEQRFDYKIRLLSTFIYLLNSLLMMPITLYAPSIALSHMTQLPVLACTTLIGGICILYTTFGGFKAVIWTDTLQATLMLASCIVVAILGVANAGGISQVWNYAQQSDIVHFFDMDLNPLKRITFWTSTLGMGMVHVAHSGSSASALQRYMSLPGQREARISTSIGAISSIVLHLTLLMVGLAMFSSYHQCDPKLNGEIEKPNQITTYFITNTIKNIAGFNGLFMAGLLSAALSTLSSELNTVGGLVYHDVILKFIKNKFIISNEAFIMKIIVLVIGMLYLCIVPFVQSPHVYELTILAGSLTYGVKIGILLLAIFFTKVNSKGVICGVIVCISFMVWINIGSHMNDASIKSHYQYKHSVTNCHIVNNTGTVSIMDSSWTTETITPINISIALNSTTQITTTDIIATAITPTATKESKLEDIFFLYRISLFYYALIGTIITMVVAIVVSYLTGGSNKDIQEIDPQLLSPLLRTYIKKQQITMQEMQTVNHLKSIKV